jgi:N-acetylmuramoyl-L-alanine amidase
LTEAEINFQVAQYVAKTLELRGYHVDVLDEFDARLTGYRALLLLSIHADSCDYINDQATGFKVARVLDSKVPEAEDRLVTCLRDRYAARTGMEYHANSITPDMTSYHGFYEVAPETPSAIIEIGFMYLDRVMLTDHADVVAQGIVNGIICFLTNY